MNRLATIANSTTETPLRELVALRRWGFRVSLEHRSVGIEERTVRAFMKGEPAVINEGLVVKVSVFFPQSDIRLDE